MLRAMVTRSTSRAAAPSDAVQKSVKRVANGASAASAASSVAPMTTTKRARYVPPPLKQEEQSTDKNVGLDTATNVPSTSSPVRYSLRRRTTLTNAQPNGTHDVKVEESVELDTTPRKVKKEQDLFATSPRKTSAKPIKIDLDASEARPAPKRWQEQYRVLTKQRKRIVAPVDTLGCEENGKDEKRQDIKTDETDEARARRERFTLLVSLMLSSQTKDPVTAEAVHNLQRNLPNGLCLESILAASQDDISSSINKVGFWRRKTGYVQSAARIIRDDFDGDVPKTIDELCSLPGVGPKMGFLCLQGAWNINIGIGVDVHVHRVANRLKWVNSNDPEGTRLQLQSWLPKELHRTINKTLVGFGQVICQPVGPRCDLCALGAARLCPSYRRVDPKSVATRVKVELLPEMDDDDDDVKEELTAMASFDGTFDEPQVVVKMEGSDGTGAVLVKKEEDLPSSASAHLDW